MKLSTGIILIMAAVIIAASPLLTVAAPPGTANPFYSSVPTAYMDDPRRNDWQQPDLVLEHLLTKQGETIADIGAGTGYFTMLFARKTGPSGIVYASDVDETMVRHIEKRARKEGLSNVKGLLSKLDDSLLPRSSVDLVFICDTYLFIENRIAYLSRLKESMKPNSRLAIISFNKMAEVSGAPPPQKMIPKDVVIREIREAGFILEADYHFLEYQDFLLFRKR